MVEYFYYFRIGPNLAINVIKDFRNIKILRKIITITSIL